MPSIKDKLKAEERNERTIRLWPEGTFFKAYERSAYLFIKQVRAYEPRRRYIQAVGQDVVSIGFPQTVLETLGVNHAPATDGAEVIQLQTALDEQQFMLWRDEFKGDEEPVAEAKPDDKSFAVIKRLREFNLATATPMDCMLLVMELQNMIK